MTLSALARSNKPSATMALMTTAADMKAKGLPVISLVAGEPDYPTPDNICVAGIRAISTGDTKIGQINGTLALRTAISAKLRKENALDYKPSQVVVAAGTKPLLHAAFLSICDEGDEVILPAPYWVSYPAIIEMARAKPVVLACEEHQGFKLKPEQLRAAITSRTRAVLLNSPNNPSGAVYSEAELRALLDVLKEFPQVYVVTDEIYEHLVYDGERHVSPASLDPSMIERFIVINGFSKGYGMIGWRLGFAAASQPIIDAMSGFLGHIVGSPSTIVQAAALEALVGDQSFIEANVSVYAGRRQLCLQAVSDIKGLTCSQPLGSFFLFMGCANLLGKTSPAGTALGTSADVAAAVLAEAGVALVPGEAFGLPGYLRLSYSADEETLRQALDKLKSFCTSLR